MELLNFHRLENKPKTMAEMNLPQKTGKRKTQNPRVDLTPMVDLGFLLITFFIFTTTMAKPKTMELNLPSIENPDTRTVFIDTSTITLLPGKNHTVIYYEGRFDDQKMKQNTGIKDVREILLRKQKQASNLPAGYSEQARKLHVVIKPTNDCVYEDVVNLLDEMNILQVPYYAISSLNEEESSWLQ
jgi:biopolymer transport protein ExbD